VDNTQTHYNGESAGWLICGHHK